MDLGPVLWAHTKAWLQMRELLSTGVAGWSSSSLGSHVSQAEGYVERYADRSAGSRNRGNLGELVAAYTLNP